MSEEFFFLLPHLVQEGLIADDSRDYALCEYDREVITSAARIVVPFLGLETTDVHLNVSKKRVKFLMEFLAVALSMPTKDFALMDVARTYYRRWIEDPSIFGDDVKRQNKYLRRIIKQLSLPFELREPNADVFKTSFAPVLSRIIGDYSQLMVSYSPKFEEETWLVILNVCFGICTQLLNGNLEQFLGPEETAKMKKDAYFVCFDVFLNCGIKKKEVGDRFRKYCGDWSRDYEFLLVWTDVTNGLFNELLCATYGLPVSEPVLSTGIFAEKRPSRETIVVLLCHCLDAVDMNAVRASPKLLKQLQIAIANTVKAAIRVSAEKSEFFLMRFPEASYMKLFGRFLIYLTETPVPREFQEALAINVDSLLAILYYFQRHDTTIAKKIVEWMLVVVNEKHPLVVQSFLNSANNMFSVGSVSPPVIAQQTLDLIPTLSQEVRGRLEFVDSVIGVFVSSVQTLKGMEEKIEPIQKALDALWEISSAVENRFPLLCAMHQCDPALYPLFFDATTKALEAITPGAPEKEWKKAVAAISYVGYLVLVRPSVESLVNEKQLVPQILDALMNPQLLGQPKYPELIIAASQMALNMMNWTDIFSVDGNIAALFRFVNYFSALVSSEKKGAHKGASKSVSRENIPTLESGEPGQSAPLGELRSMIGKIHTMLLSRINLRVPWRDHFSRVVDSSCEISEDYIIKKLGLTDTVISYYSIGYSLLVSFIEKEDGSGPMVVFARGAFGRSVWVVEQDYQGTRPTPQLSTEIQKESLPAIDTLKPTGLERRGNRVDVFDYLNMGELEAQDKHLQDKFVKDFTTWLNWDEFGYYYPHNYAAPYQRRRVVDFLVTLGICDTTNKADVRSHERTDSLLKMIRKLDELEKPEIVPIVVKHVLPSDASLDGTKEHEKRMTPLMKKFLTDIGEPLKIGEQSSKIRGLPTFKTNAPSIPFCDGWAVCVSSAMVADPDPCRIVDAIEAPITIIFNETDFDLKQSFEDAESRLVLIVKPCSNNLYRVTRGNKAKELLTPFASKQAMTIDEISFNIGMYVEMTSSFRKHENILRSKRSLVSELCKDKARRDFGQTAGGIFK